jgi:hypothetical protein
MALYIVVSVLFGVFIGYFYLKTKNSEVNSETERRHFKILNDKNESIMRLKNEVRSLQRKIDAINQGYDLQSKLLIKERELSENEQKLKSENRDLSIELSKKIKIIDEKDQIIALLEDKIKQSA